MIESRAELIFLLTEAAELEHSLCCQYLYAAFSLKTRVEEGLTWEQLGYVQDWCQTLFMIARQEMEHLSLASNLLTAIGGAPSFDRPNFPQPARYFPFPLTLERFGPEALRRFIYYEEPGDLPPERSVFPDAARAARAAPPPELSPAPVPFRHVGELYAAIRAGFAQLPLSDRELFIGPPGSQVDGWVLNLNFPRVGSLGGVYDVSLFPIADRASALRAVDQIIEEGEGLADQASPFSHYQRFLRMYEELLALQSADPAFQPARPLVANPTLRAHSDASGGTPVTNPAAAAVLDLFNSAYETLLLLLARFYGHSDETQAELAALMQTLFPMMTMVLRPIGEVLVSLDATPDPRAGLAGPSFEISAPVPFLPHKAAAWAYLGERLQALAATAAALSGEQGMPKRLAYIAESIDLLSVKFQRQIAGGP